MSVDMFVEPDADPRVDLPPQADERATFHASALVTVGADADRRLDIAQFRWAVRIGQGAAKELNMRIAFGADDENEATRAVVEFLATAGHEVIRPAKSDAWPEIGAAVGGAVVSGDVDFGVVMCWTGTGTSIAANKVPGVRAALAWDAWIAAGARRWNDANVLALSLKRLAPAVAVEVTKAFLADTPPDPAEAANIAQLGALEQW